MKNIFFALLCLAVMLFTSTANPPPELGMCGFANQEDSPSFVIDENVAPVAYDANLFEDVALAIDKEYIPYSCNQTRNYNVYRLEGKKNSTNRKVTNFARHEASLIDFGQSLKFGVANWNYNADKQNRVKGSSANLQV